MIPLIGSDFKEYCVYTQRFSAPNGNLFSHKWTQKEIPPPPRNFFSGFFGPSLLARTSAYKALTGLPHSSIEEISAAFQDVAPFYSLLTLSSKYPSLTMTPLRYGILKSLRRLEACSNLFPNKEKFSKFKSEEEWIQFSEKSVIEFWFHLEKKLYFERSYVIPPEIITAFQATCMGILEMPKKATDLTTELKLGKLLLMLYKLPDIATTDPNDQIFKSVPLLLAPMDGIVKKVVDRSQEPSSLVAHPWNRKDLKVVLSMFKALNVSFFIYSKQLKTTHEVYNQLVKYLLDDRIELTESQDAALHRFIQNYLKCSAEINLYMEKLKAVRAALIEWSRRDRTSAPLSPETVELVDVFNFQADQLPFEEIMGDSISILLKEMEPHYEAHPEMKSLLDSMNQFLPTIQTYVCSPYCTFQKIVKETLITPLEEAQEIRETLSQLSQTNRPFNKYVLFLDLFLQKIIQDNSLNPELKKVLVLLAKISMDVDTSILKSSDTLKCIQMINESNINIPFWTRIGPCNTLMSNFPQFKLLTSPSDEPSVTDGFKQLIQSNIDILLLTIETGSLPPPFFAALTQLENAHSLEEFEALGELFYGAYISLPRDYAQRDWIELLLRPLISWAHSKEYTLPQFQNPPKLTKKQKKKKKKIIKTPPPDCCSSSPTPSESFSPVNFQGSPINLRETPISGAPTPSHFSLSPSTIIPCIPGADYLKDFSKEFKLPLTPFYGFQSLYQGSTLNRQPALFYNEVYNLFHNFLELTLQTEYVDTISHNLQQSIPYDLNLSHEEYTFLETLENDRISRLKGSPRFLDEIQEQFQDDQKMFFNILFKWHSRKHPKFSPPEIKLLDNPSIPIPRLFCHENLLKCDDLASQLFRKKLVKLDNEISFFKRCEVYRQQLTKLGNSLIHIDQVLIALEQKTTIDYSIMHQALYHLAIAVEGAVLAALLLQPIKGQETPNEHVGFDSEYGRPLIYSHNPDRLFELLASMYPDNHESLRALLGRFRNFSNITFRYLSKASDRVDQLFLDQLQNLAIAAVDLPIVEKSFLNKNISLRYQADDNADIALQGIQQMQTDYKENLQVTIEQTLEAINQLLTPLC
ncbi:MAG: hypothetical protein ACOYK9_01810 [Chlamydiia bacterium]